MKIIEGLAQAKTLLSRELPSGLYPISDGLKRSLKKMFGTEDPEQAVRIIIAEVRRRGDAALFDYAAEIDGMKLASLEISRKQIADAYKEVDSELLAALKLAAERIEAFHSAQKKSMWHEVSKDGLEQKIRPLHRIGAYVPGGTAAYPSTVLMTAIPAKVAGVKEVILATPPRGAGAVPAPNLVAADIAQVDRIFRVGGAQAVAALAYGTESIPKVDKICGPGNIFVMLAKKLVFGAVDIDGLQGPSEVLIIADKTADPAYRAADLLAQAEHDPLASAILVTDSAKLAQEVNREVDKQLKELSRREIVAESLETTGKIVVVANLDEAVELANLYAPEHLCLVVEKTDAYKDRIVNAGCVYVGESSATVLGDYVAGTNHALPTSGTAKFSSPLNIIDFMKLTNFVTIDKANLKKLGPAAAIIARAEGFEAHAKAVEKRLKTS